MRMKCPNVVPHHGRLHADSKRPARNLLVGSGVEDKGAGPSHEPHGTWYLVYCRHLAQRFRIWLEAAGIRVCSIMTPADSRRKFALDIGGVYPAM